MNSNTYLPFHLETGRGTRLNYIFQKSAAGSRARSENPFDPLTPLRFSDTSQLQIRFNPPYIRVQELLHEDIDYYKRFYSTAWKRIDISTLFIEIGYKLGHQDGYVSYITSNQFLTTEYGRRIRHVLSEKAFVRKIVEFSDLPVFDGALTYVDIFFFKTNARRKSFDYYKVPGLPFIVPNEDQFIKIEFADMEDDGWILKSKAVRQCLDKMRHATPDTLKRYAKCWAGAFTGKDDILMFDIDQNTPFEDNMVIPVIRAESCGRYEYAQPSRKIYYPYSEYRFAAPQVFGKSFYAFRGRYFYMGGYGGYVPQFKKEMTDDFLQRLHSIAFRVRKDECLDMPPIDYSWGQINFEVQPMNWMLMAEECLAKPMMAEGASYDMDIEPDDIEVSDTVTVLWEIS